MTITQEQRAARDTWVEALESGQFAQCQKRLFDGVGYCCLGVAEVSLGHTFETRSYLDCDCPSCTGDSPDYVVSGTRESVVLTRLAQARLGFASNDPWLWVLPEGIPEPVSLAILNDAHGYTFEQIARVIRAQPEDWDGTHRDPK